MFCVLKLTEQFLYVIHCRKLRDKIKAKMTEKQKLMYIMTKDRGKRNIEKDSTSTLFPDFIIDIPSPSIPQLQVCVARTVLTQCLQHNVLDLKVSDVECSVARIVRIIGYCHEKRQCLSLHMCVQQ